MAKSPARRGPGYLRLERQLSLLAWLNHQLGYADTGEMLSDLKTLREGFDDAGRSYILQHLATREQPPLIPLEQLHTYDDNLRCHLQAINAGARRGDYLTLRYFQYLAALYAEIYLDRWFAGPDQLRDNLNAFIHAERNRGRTEAEQWPLYQTADLSKLAFWMATGSGKTLLLHLNYRQFLHYRRQHRPDAAPLKNILLITPNEGLSRQHRDELKLSNIRDAAPFDWRSDGGLFTSDTPLRTIEITKLVLEKTGEGESVPVEVFEPDNLIFVDEGHKGSGGAVWRQVRDTLGATGFTFEYSATFGQALAAANNAALFAEYGKSIAFDYSYRYFYTDGYGKEFRILNLTQETTPQNADLLLLANLLSFYQQQRYYAANRADLAGYNLARPLAVFVGGSVNAVYTQNKRPRSDVLTVCQFLHRVLSDPDWAQDAIDQLLAGNSGFRQDDGADLFAGQFAWLTKQRLTPDAVYRDLLRETLRVDPDAAGGLLIRDLQGSDGELGLIAAGSNDYFGVINIGDTAAFKKLVRENAPELAPPQDYHFAPSLFADINHPDTPVNLLVGSRKFMEGWNSWRVANMGLLNIGQSEGSQIIQLFGRGVRLKGRAMSLKRSSPDNAPPGGHPKQLRLLETLNIFALRANYMGKFREYLENEGINESIPLEIPIRSNAAFLGQNLVIPRLDATAQFDASEVVVLRHNPAAVKTPVTVDLSATVGVLQSGSPADRSAIAGQELHIPPPSLDLVDWTAAWLNLLEYKTRQGYHCLVIPPENLRNILAAHTANEPIYRLIADAALAHPASYADRQRLQAAVTAILQKYADALYRQRRMEWETQRLVYQPLTADDPNFQFNAPATGNGQYQVRVSGENRNELARQIKALLDDCNALYQQDAAAPLPRIHFDRHLYQPLLLKPGQDITLSPPGLNDGEQNFVHDLRKFWEQERHKLPPDTEVFLLRNQSRGRGVGFYETRHFFPDFILWVKTGAAQRIIFVEPHGMRHELPYGNNEKAQLHARLPQLAADIAQRSSGETAVELDAFIISVTPYDKLTISFDDGSWSRERFAENHILFREGDSKYDYLERIFRVAREPANG